MRSQLCATLNFIGSTKQVHRTILGGWCPRAPVFRTPKFAVPAVAYLCQDAMDDETAARIAEVTGACMGAAMITVVDKRRMRAPPSGTSTFRNTTFEEAMNPTSTNWFHKKLRMDKVLFIRIYKVLTDAWPHKPAANSRGKLIKRVALTILYLAQGCTMEAVASMLGISRPRAVMYIDDTLDVLN
ncbi:hypothetical protein ON010_g12375 [Phytophthora cinnamomi]|nr:hypothetical protein ON010_g12375 [Phytophthora cinnamomi]